MRNVSLRLGGAVAAVCVAGAAIAVALPATAATRPAITGHAKYSTPQLLEGILFQVGPVGKIIYGSSTSTPTSIESKFVKDMEVSLGKSQSTVALELQSGKVVQFAQAVGAINQAFAQQYMASLAPKSGAATIAAISSAQAALSRRGDLGTTCSSTTGTDAVACAQSPASVRPNSTGVFIWQDKVAVAAVDSYWFWVATQGASIVKGNPNSVAVQQLEGKLVTALRSKA